MNDLQDECDGWRSQCEINEDENTTLRGLLIEAREEYDKAFDILGALSMCMDGASAEEHAKEVFCGGCYSSLDTALEYVQSIKPDWYEAHTFDADELAVVLKRKREDEANDK